MAYHPAMKHAGPTRREIGVRTAFNLLGPVTNPAGASRQVIGVGDPSVAARLAEVLRMLGTERSFIVHGAGIDELPLDGTGILYDVTPSGVKRRPVVASQLGPAGRGPGRDARRRNPAGGGHDRFGRRHGAAGPIARGQVGPRRGQGRGENGGDAGMTTVAGRGRSHSAGGPGA